MSIILNLIVGKWVLLHIIEMGTKQVGLNMEHNETPQPDVAPIEGTKFRADFAIRVHVYINEYIRFADTKAALILTACGFIFSLALSQADKFGHTMTVAYNVSAGWFGIIVGLASLLTGAVLYTVINCILCVYPRLSSSGHSKIYFGDIAGGVPIDAKLTTEAKEELNELLNTYVGDVHAFSANQCVAEFCTHNFWLSRIAIKKFQLVQKATKGLCFVFTLSLLLSVAFTIVFFLDGNIKDRSPQSLTANSTQAITGAPRANNTLGLAHRNRLPLTSRTSTPQPQPIATTRSTP